jgi:putative ABC transport system permease protein
LMGSSLFEVAVLVAGGLAGALIVAAWVLPALLRAFASLGGAPGLTEVSFGTVARLAVAGSAAAFLVLATFCLFLSRAHTSRASLWRTSAAQVVNPGTRRLFFFVVVSEIAFATALVYGSWLLHQTVTVLAHVRTGFEAQGVVTVRFLLSHPAAASPSRRVTVYTDLLRRLQEVPDILATAGVRGLPLSQPYGTPSAAFFSMPTSEWDLVPVWIPPATRYAPSTHAELRLVTPRYFEALKIPLHEGRDFQDVDDFNAPAVAIVSASLARHVGSLDAPRQTHVSYEFAGTTRTVTVIGVVDDVLNKSLMAPAMPTLYIPYFQMPFAHMTIVARVGHSARFDWAESTTRAIGDAARAADPAGTTSDARTLDSIVAAASGRSRTAARMMLAISSLTCLVVLVGVYGTQTYMLRQRLGELAMRHVLGATRKALVVSVLREALGTGLVGLSIGWVFAVMGAHLLRASLHGVPVVDLGGVLIVSCAITVGVLFASAPTARRAARLEPVEILRGL